MVNIILVVIVPIVLILGFVGALLPYLITPPGKALTDWKARFISFGNCFCGGVLLSTGLLHMIPDEMEVAEELGKDHPIPEIFILAGFLSLAIIEYSGVVQFVVNYYKRKGQQKSPINESLLANEELINAELAKINKEILVEDTHDHDHDHHDNKLEDIHHHEEGHQHHHEFVVNGTLPALLTLILCCHSVFEGLSLGSSETEHTQISLSLAIIAHRLFEAFALGACCRKAEVSYMKAITGITIYSLVSPLCTVIGYIAKDSLEGNKKKWIEMIFQGCAAGTFLHISILEVIAEETEDGKHLFYKLIFILIGAILMGSIAFLV